MKKIFKPMLFDGAFGTYYKNLTRSDTSVELASRLKPQVVTDIHAAYVEAGADCIRTNTFGVYTLLLNETDAFVSDLVKSAFNHAKVVANGSEATVFASLGPLEADASDEEIEASYKVTIDALIEAGADNFILETFPETLWINRLSAYILEKHSEATIFASCAVNQYGYTKLGTSFKHILEQLMSIEGLKAYGFNCSVGPGHMKQLLKKIDIPNCFYVMPNAGYPEMVLNRETYQENSDYFSEQMQEICEMGVGIIGSCCGSTPEHTRKLRQVIDRVAFARTKRTASKASVKHIEIKENNFKNKLKKSEFVIAVELDPPHHTKVDRLMEAANIIKHTGADIITIADSPLGKSRLDSIMMAAKIKREVGIDAMPHLCCRDKNVIAIRSMILAGYVEDIRNMLLVTGDPVPQLEKSVHKSVFNLNAIKLMDMVGQLNLEHMGEDAIFYGGAFDPKGQNMDKVIQRVMKKKEAGASYLLTQPIYTKEEVAVIDLIRRETGIKVLGGILPLVSYKNARFIHNEFSGMDIPLEIRQKFTPEMSRQEAQDVGVQIAVDIGKMMRPYVDGLYLMTPFNRAEMMSEIIEQLK